MSKFQGATWSLKIGHQVVHLAVGRELVVAIRMLHVRRIFGRSVYFVLEDSRPLVRALVQEVLWQTGGGCFLVQVRFRRRERGGRVREKIFWRMLL